METTRREFLDSLVMSTLAGTAVLGGVPTMLSGMERAPGDRRAGAAPLDGAAPQEGWDTEWGKRLTGRLKAVFDVPEIESGFPVWRASIWTAQYEQVLRVPARETSTALVLRHNAIVLAMQQGYWAKYGFGAASKATHPLTGEPSSRNVALLDASDGVGAPYSEFALDKFLSRGGVALACDLALRFIVVPIIQKAEGVSDERAYALARQGLVPGVILQPSGMFAVIRAQEAGAFYFRAG